MLTACTQQNRQEAAAENESVISQAEVTPPEEIQAPEAASAEAPATQPEELSNMLQSFTGDTQQAGGEWAAAVQRADEGRCIASNSRPMQSASLIKLFVAATVEENMDMVTAGEQYSGETADLLFSMLSQSDNEAAYTQVRRLGGGDAAAAWRWSSNIALQNGYEDTSMGG